MTRRYITEALVKAADSSLTEHDRQILKTVFDLRFVSGDQLARRHFAAADPVAQARSARRALVRLVRLDVLARLPRRVGGIRAGSAGFVYHPGTVGHRLAIGYGFQPERPRRRSEVPGTAFIRHFLAVAELHTLLIEADRSGRFELLELSAEPSCWRRYGGIGAQRSQTLKPDSYVRAGLGEYEDSYFIEMDRGTEGSTTIDRKLREYLAYQATGIEQDRRAVFPRVLWLVPDKARAGAIEASVRRLPMPNRKLFAVALQADALSVVSHTSLTQSQDFS